MGFKLQFLSGTGKLAFESGKVLGYVSIPNIWAYDTDGDFKWNFATGNHCWQLGVYASGSSITDIIALTEAGSLKNVWSLDISDGSVVWDKLLDGLQGHNDSIGFDSSDNVYMVAYTSAAASWAKLYSLDVDGVENWNYVEPNNSNRAGLVYGMVDSNDNFVYGFGAFVNSIRSVDNSGSSNWVTAINRRIVCVAMNTSDNISVGTFYDSSHKDPIQSYDSSGTQLWTYDVSSHTTLTNFWIVKADSSGRTIGMGQDSSNFTNNWIVSVDSTGSFVWGANISGADFSAITVDSSDNVIIGTTGNNLYKYSPTGTLLWNITVGTGTMYLNAADSNGDVFVLMIKSGAPNHGKAFLKKYQASDGAELWSVLVGTPVGLTRGGANMIVDNSDNIIFAVTIQG